MFFTHFPFLRFTTEHRPEQNLNDFTCSKRALDMQAHLTACFHLRGCTLVCASKIESYKTHSSKALQTHVKRKHLYNKIQQSRQPE